MVPSKPTKFESSNGSFEVSSLNYRKQENSSIGKITKMPIKCQTAKNVLNHDSIKKVQGLVDEDIDTNSQRTSSQFGVENVLTATTQTAETLRKGKIATGKALSPVQKLPLAASQHPHQYRPFFEISSLTHLPRAHPYGPALDIGSSAPLPNAHHYCPALEFGSSAPSPYAYQYNPTLYSRPTSSIVQSQQYNYPLDHELPEGFRNPHQYNPTAEADVPEASWNSQHQGTSLGPSLFQCFKPALQYDALVTSTLQQGAECSQQNLALLHPALPEGFHNYPQYNNAAFERLATHYGQARVSGQPFETASSAGFQIQHQVYSPGGSSSVDFLRSLAAPMPDDGTEGESRRSIIVLDCSVDAAEQNAWHMAMNRHGVYRPKGEIRYAEDGTMQWREKEGARWCNAVKHEDIRRHLLAECAQLGEYTYPRDKGKAVDSDITAFHPDQKDWAFRERHLRPEILHQYESRGYQSPTYPVQIWLYRGTVVLDHVNHPILDFKNMPKTVSSQVEGGLQEAITRQDFRIDVNDFRVRMPSDPKNQGVISLPTLSAISMRRSRFRWGAGYLSWTPRTGCQDIKNFLDGLLPDSCKETNSTREFRDLKPSEVKRMTLPNRGKHLSRAGKRRLSPGASEKSERAFQRGLRRAEESEDLAV